jgi:hypothetical protein
MQNAEREDLTWVVLQFWLFAMTFLAIIWNSVPHLYVFDCQVPDFIFMLYQPR